MACTLGSRLLGFLRIAVIGAIFGASGTADVWNAVFTIPNNFRKLLAEGALSSAFIPSLSESLLEDTSGKLAQKITCSIITFQLTILLPLTALAFLFAGPIIQVLLSFPEPEKMIRSGELFRWTFSYLIFISISAVLMAVLNSHNIFVIPALTPLFFSICMIGSTLLLYRRMGIFSMAVGIILGGIAQICFQLPKFLSLGYDMRLDFHFGYERFKRILKAWLPVLISASIFAITQQVAVLLASGLEDGSASALSNALVFFQLPFGIFSTAVVTVLFPRMSRQAALKDTGGLTETLSYGLRFILILLIPAAIFYIFMGKEIIGVALERYKFSEQNTLWAAKVLTGYSLGLFSLGGFTFLQRFFYSLQDFRTPLIVSAIVSVIDIILSLWLKETPLRVTGLAVANSIAFTLGFLVLLIRASLKLGGLNGKMILNTVRRLILSMLPFSAFIWAYLHFTGPVWTSGSSIRNLILVLIALVLGAGIVLVMYYVTGLEILQDIIKVRRGKK